MTDHFPLPDDELASAYVDGAVGADERARVESDPDLLARADRLADVRRAVAASGPVPEPAQRDQHIANALAMVGTVAPISLADRRDRRLRRRLTVLSAAAAILVVVGVLAVTAANRRDNNSLSATAGSAGATTSVAAAEALAGGSKSDSAAPATTAAAAATTTTAAGAAFSTTIVPASAPSSPDLGPIDANTAPSVLSDAGNRVGDRAVQPPPACAVPPGTRYVGSAVYSGTPVFAFVTAPDAAEQRGVLLDTATCAVVADLRLT